MEEETAQGVLTILVDIIGAKGQEIGCKPRPRPDGQEERLWACQRALHRAATLHVRARSGRRRRGKGGSHSPMAAYGRPSTVVVQAVPRTGQTVSSMRPRPVPCRCMHLDRHGKRLENSRGTLTPENLAASKAPPGWRADSPKPPRSTSIRLRTLWQGLPGALIKGTFQNGLK